MPVEVIMPKVDMDMESGKLAVWHAAPGDAVEKGAALFDIETDKAAMEVEAPSSGVLAHVIAEEGVQVAVGAPVAWIYVEGEDVPEEPPALPGAADKADATASEEVEPQVAIPPKEMPAPRADAKEVATNDRARATPAARGTARQLGLDLRDIAGSGPRGRVHADDVARHAEAPSAPMVASAAPVIWNDQPGGLAVRRSGSGSGAPVVLLHGFAADSTGWLPLERALGKSREIIRIDLPSHGTSPRKRVGDFARLARLVVEAFDALNLERAHIVGHSLGGAVATALADIRAPRVASLGLLAPAGLGPGMNSDVLGGIARASRTESLLPWLRQLADNQQLIDEGFARAAMRTRQDPQLRAAQLDLAETLFPDGTQSFDLTPALGRFEMPVSVLWGREDRIFDWRHALRLSGSAAIHLLPKTGHIPHVECPETVAKVLKRLFKSAET